MSFTNRPPWHKAPADLRAAVCGGEVVAARDVHGGMSPGPAAILTLANGDTVFAKAVSSAVSAGAPWLDAALLAADVVAAGHLDGPATARREALRLLADEPPEAARFVIAQAGMWRRNSTLPPHPGLPTHRAWQRARAAALEPLLADLLDWQR
ncbi:hypothetical protein SAMN05421812_101755 [Asanoa hainanensis]|uniref:Uncharacterized protein n=1 Tax=Asanoa hainanensis TaxID=560556 RepID=A0A239H8T3_9ACTN|nr:hypothetical protein [Asanoa hainanensis]SNS77846.1 hypothetical protein SAMN05421812_101755 [Asanoa hainanensis]